MKQLSGIQMRLCLRTLSGLLCTKTLHTPRSLDVDRPKVGHLLVENTTNSLRRAALHNADGPRNLEKRALETA